MLLSIPIPYLPLFIRLLLYRNLSNYFSRETTQSAVLLLTDSMCQKGRNNTWSFTFICQLLKKILFWLVLCYYKCLDLNIFTVGFFCVCFSSYLLCFNPFQLYYAEIVPSLLSGWLLSLFAYSSCSLIGLCLLSGTARCSRLVFT